MADQELIDTTARPDAIDILLTDHRTVDGLFTRFEELRWTGEVGARRDVVDSIVRELREHARMEEHVFYPSIRTLLADGNQLADEAIEEHQQVKTLLQEIDSLAPDYPSLETRMATLIADVRHHVNEEEKDILPKLRQAVGENVLFDLGRALEAAKLEQLGEPAPAGTVAEPITMVPRKATPRKTAARKTAARKATTRTTAKRSTAKKPTSKRTAAKGTSPRVRYRVKPSPRGWEVSKQGAKRPSGTFDRKADAVARGKELAKRFRRGQLVVHGQDGKVRDEFTYGDDPRRTKG
jgi:hemerythrin superfamily protein